MNGGVPCDWQPIDTAPRDGRVILVKHDDVGAFAMAWNATATNDLIPDQIGLWELVDKSMTWCDGGDEGPWFWKPLPDEAAEPSKDNLPPLRRSGIKLEVTAGQFNSIVNAGRMDDFDRAAEDHRYARDEFRNELERTTGMPSSLIERLLSL